MMCGYVILADFVYSNLTVKLEFGMKNKHPLAGLTLDFFLPCLLEQWWWCSCSCSFPSLWQKMGKVNFISSAVEVCSGAAEPKHRHAAETTTQHDTSLSLSHRKPVNSGISAIIKAFWLITPFNWTIPVARAKWCLVSSAAERRERTNKQENKWGHKQPPVEALGTHGLARRRDETDLQTQQLIRRHVPVCFEMTRLLSVCWSYLFIYFSDGYIFYKLVSKALIYVKQQPVDQYSDANLS